jgi:hypothetical protein
MEWQRISELYGVVFPSDEDAGVQVVARPPRRPSPLDRPMVTCSRVRLTFNPLGKALYEISNLLLSASMQVSLISSSTSLVL